MSSNFDDFFETGNEHEVEQQMPADVVNDEAISDEKPAVRKSRKIRWRPKLLSLRLSRVFELLADNSLPELDALLDNQQCDLSCCTGDCPGEI